MPDNPDIFFNEKEKKWFFLTLKIGIGLVGLIIMIAVIILANRADAKLESFPDRIADIVLFPEL